MRESILGCHTNPHHPRILNLHSEILNIWSTYFVSVWHQVSYEDIYNYKDEHIERKNIRHPDLELSELQKMTQAKAIRLFRKGRHTENINRRQLIMSIIMAASRVQWSKTDKRGIREFWYNPVKPIFGRVFGKAIDDMDESQVSAICDNMGHILSVMVQSKIIRYEDLGIEDFRTQRMLWESIDNADCWSNVILFVEKDSAYIHLRPLKKLLNITLMSGGGVSKTALNEYLMDHLPKGKYTLYPITDYDPWGFFISGECFMKLKRMGWDIEVIRIGLDVDQVSKEIIANQKYPVKMDAKGQVWAPKYGILGRLRKVYRTRKATIKDPETGKKKKIDERYLAYEGRKGWGLEIEAVSGQVGGAQVLREIVLAALLKKEEKKLSTGEIKEVWKRLKEEDRLDEIKTPLWEEIGWDEETNPFSEEEWTNYQEHEWSEIEKYVTEEECDELKEGRESVWESDRKPLVDRAKRIIEEDNSLESTRYDLSRSIAQFIRTAKELATRRLDEQIEELNRKRRVILRKIENTSSREEKTMVGWLSFSRWNLKLLAEKYGEELDAIDDPYNEDIEEVEEQKAKSDSIRIVSYVEWFDENKEKLFASKTNEEEELSFGLMPGVHLDILKKGGDVSDLFSKVYQFDKNRIYEYIWNVAETEEEDNIDSTMDENIGICTNPDSIEAWHEKWDKYLEAEG